MVKETTPQTFDADIAKGQTVVDFWAPWCGPCKLMAPYFEEASKQTKTVQFLKANVDDYGELGEKFDVQGIPTLIYFKDGKEVARFVGAVGKDELTEQLSSTFKLF